MKLHTKFHEAAMIGNALKTPNTLAIASVGRRRKNYKAENGIFENAISPEPNGILRRCKRH